MRTILLLPDNELIKQQLETCEKAFSKVPWIDYPGSLEALADRLLQDDCKKGYVVRGFPDGADDPETLEKLIIEKHGKKKPPLPLYLYWNGKPKKDQREAVKAFREQVKPQAQYLYTNRRLVNFPKIKKMKKAFKEAKARSRPGRIVRRGVAIAAAVLAAIVLGVLLLFRDMILHPVTIDVAQSQTGAKVDIEVFQTGLSDLSLHLENVAAADPEQPMQNIASFESLQTSWNAGALMSGKLHADTLSLDGLAFGTARKESGALPVEPPSSSTEEAAEMAEALGKPEQKEEDDFVKTLNNTMGEFEPPKKEDLESTKVLNKYEALATEREASINAKVQAIDVDKSIAESRAAADQLKAISITGGDQSAVQAKLDQNKKALEALQIEVAADVALIKKDVDALKGFKVDVKDLKKAKEQIDQAKSLRNRIDAVRGKIKKAEALAADSKQQVKQAGDGIKQQVADAQKQLDQQVAAVKKPLTDLEAQIADVSKEAQTTAAEIREAKPAFNQAVERDTAKLKDQYSVDGIKDGSKQLIEELVGVEFFSGLESALVWYRRIKPWLPVSEKTAKPKPSIGTKGTNYDFPASAEEGGMASLYIKEANLTGVLPINGKDMKFNGQITDMTSNMAYTNKPVHLKMQGDSQADQEGFEADLTMDLDSIIRGSVAFLGVTYQSGPSNVSGDMAGLMPQNISSSHVDIHINEMALGDKSLDARIRIHLKDVQVEAASGAGVHPEIAAAFNGVYKDLKTLEIEIGLGDKRTFSTTPDVGKLLGAALEKRVAAKLSEAKKKAEADMRAHGEKQLASLDTLANGVANPKALQEKQAELTKAFDQFKDMDSAERKRLLEDEAAALKELDQFSDVLKQQDALVKDQQKTLDDLKKRIDKEKKRIEKDMKGDVLKKLIPKF